MGFGLMVMRENEMEITIFVCFVGLQAVFANAPQWFEHTKRCAYVQKLSQNHYAVWLFHPTVLEGLKAYVVHFFVYSGYDLGGH